MNRTIAAFIFFLKEQKILYEYFLTEGRTTIKEFIIEASNVWYNISEQERSPYRCMAEMYKLQ